MRNLLRKVVFACTILTMISFVARDEPQFDILGTANNKKYGYTKKQPIKVGGGTSAGYHFQYLEHLRGPKGEKLEIRRIGSCGSYPNPDTTLTKYDQGVLTCFSINCSSFKEPRTLYLDKYRVGDLYIPKDCTWQK